MQTETNIPYKAMCVQLLSIVCTYDIRMGLFLKLIASYRRRSLRHRERDTISGNKSNAEGWPGLARHCLVKSYIAASLELRKHHASDCTRTGYFLNNNLWDRLIDWKNQRLPTHEMGKHIESMRSSRGTLCTKNT